MLKRSFGVIKPISEHRHGPAEPLGRIIEKMMKMELKARYQTMSEVVADLEDYQVTSIPPPRRRGPLPASTRAPSEVEEEEEIEQPGSEHLLTEERAETSSSPDSMRSRR